jgi:hypothetical protein
VSTLRVDLCQVAGAPLGGHLLARFGAEVRLGSRHCHLPVRCQVYVPGGTDSALATDARPDPVGRRRAAVPAEEFITVPHRWRPWQAIQRADEDGNPKTKPDPSWTALLTAPCPEHPSEHLCLDGAVLRVLQMFFGKGKVGFDVTSSRFPGELRHFDRFSEPLKEMIEARIWAGLHYRTADVQAQKLGRKVVAAPTRLGRPPSSPAGPDELRPHGLAHPDLQAQPHIHGGRGVTPMAWRR